jgi:integrase
MNAGTNSTNHYLRRLHNLAVGMGWLSWPLLASRLWPKTKAQPKRAITEAEHHKIVATEGNDERRLYYELLWETGASQTDAATLTADNIDWNQATISYTRHKTGEKASLAIGARLKAVLRQLPDKGPLFPRWGRVRDTDRSCEFRRRCRILGIVGVSLHSYRYAWAQRAKALGYPERWAQSALGHGSRAVHQAYARGGEVVCPPLQEYEGKVVRGDFHQKAGQARKAG